MSGPVYDCGVPDCEECQRAFGPDRSKAIAEYNARERAYAALDRKNRRIPSLPGAMSGDTDV